jgi:ribonuclease HI
LSTLKRVDIPVEIYSDSNYVCQGVNSWSKKWKANGWKNSQKKPVENKELWIQLLKLVRKFEDIKFIWVKGHADNTGNIRADELANKGISELN